ncbi:M50 family metallopeptidase [Actinomadura scrupuli]|uniref:M50 family metallopeptidase n=1 Tax=Actinomadura scrupuli TaxID=559629 RepID=UPI003D9520BB
MTYLLGVVAFVFALLASVMLHEAGHFLTAKRFGMKATQFFVGFGPTLWSWRRGETEYGVKAVLLGGYVRIVGYTPLEEIEPEDEPRAFYRQPALRRMIVICGGVVMNFVIAFVLLAALALTIGERIPGTPSTTVAVVSPCTPSALQSRCKPGDPPSPAAQAGLRPSDKILSLAGTPVRDWTALRAAIKAQPPGSTVAVVIERGGRQQTLRLKVTSVGGSSFVGMTAQVQGGGYRRFGPAGAAGYAASTIGRTVAGIGTVLADLPSAIPKLFSPDRASSPGGQVGSVVGATEVSGEIFAADAGWKEKLDAYLQLVVSVNIFLGALNVLPLLPLDGGHLAVIGYERIRVRINRLRGRSDPGTVDMTKLMPVTYLVFLVLVGFGMLLILADVFNPMTLPR